MKFIIEPELKDRGVKVAAAMVRGARISNRSLPLERITKEFVQSLQEIECYKNSPKIRAYRKLYPAEGTPPALALIKLAKKNGKLPNINTVVDAYNLVSAKTLLSIGAHDLSNIKGEIRFIIGKGTEQFTPLGKTTSTTLKKGEYACVDDEKVLCYMDLKQCDQTKITKSTKEFLVYVQGNENTSQQEVDDVLKQVLELIGGQSEIIEES